MAQDLKQNLMQCLETNLLRHKAQVTVVRPRAPPYRHFFTQLSRSCARCLTEYELLAQSCCPQY